MEQFHEKILTSEQLDLQAFAREFAEKEVAPVVKECDEKGEFPMAVFKKFCEVGFNTMFLPEALGGQGLGAMDMVVVHEEFAKVDAGFITSATCGEFGIEPILMAGTDEQKQYYMDFILQGGLGAFALTEPNSGSDASATKTIAVKDGNDYVLNGRKCFITSGPIADVYSIFATVDPSAGVKGISCFIVERDRPGVSVGRDEDKMGLRLSCTSDVVLEDVRIPAKNLVGAEGKGFGLAMKCLDRSRGVNSYAGVGIAQRALDEAVAYAKQRKTFGKPIIKHQMIQSILADMQINVTAGRALLWQCAQMVDRGVYDTKLGSTTKTFISDMAMKVTTDAVQVLGGYGYSREYPVEKLMRDAKIQQIFEGTNQIQRMVIAGALAQ